MKASINDKISIIQRMYDNNQFNPYIKYITFPYYKNLENNTNITFDFPLTVLVGGNGTNKSSILKALEACCPDHTLSKRWFSTHIDAIPEKPVQAFVYGYDLEKGKKTIEAQVLIAKYFRADDPDYWETARPVISYGMKKFLTDKKEKEFWGVNTRWMKIANKKPVYLTFRDSISAFDKFFYYGDTHPIKKDLSLRKDSIRRNSRPLNNAIQNSLKSLTFDRKERIIKNIELDADHLTSISDILGYRYQKISMILHTFFNCEGYTCKIKKNDIDYSEAFAGSGEFAVIKIVHEILKCDSHSLILLDEPEVSLHPGAQERLISFLLDQIKLKKLQIVIASHSPTIIRHLPAHAIKVLNLNAHTNKVEISKQSCSADEAFYYIGEPIPNKKTVLVEDKLADFLVKYAIDDLTNAQKNQLDIKYFSGGALDLLNTFVVSCALEETKNIYIYLDGDQKTLPLSNIDDLSQSELLKIPEAINKFCGGELKIPFDSGMSLEAKLPKYKSIFNWLKNYVYFLPTTGNPESIIWDKMTDKLESTIDSKQSYKEKFCELTKITLGSNDISSTDILAIQRMQLNKIKKDDEDIQEIKNTFLTKILV